MIVIAHAQNMTQKVRPEDGTEIGIRGTGIPLQTWKACRLHTNYLTPDLAGDKKYLVLSIAHNDTSNARFMEIAKGSKSR